jgi:DNA-directed RNA polymerase specialized sigma subunit
MFVDKMVDHLRKHKDIPEITRSQRFAHRLELQKIFLPSILKNKQKRNRKIAEAVQKHGYTQRAIAAHLEMHYSYISQIVKTSGLPGFGKRERKDKC